jgi:hypothetical protein
MPVEPAMKALPLLCGLMLLAGGPVFAAKVYKWTDEEGNVIYSDTPRPGAVEIDIPTEPAGIVPVPPEKIPAPKPLEAAAGYGSLIIASPRSDQVIEDAGGAVNVSLALAPALQADKGHAIRLRLDGQALDARYTEAEITIPSVERGTHTLEAEVVDPSGAVLIASSPVTFTVQAPSMMGPAGPDIYEPVYPPPSYEKVYPPMGPPPATGRPKPIYPPQPQPSPSR